MSPILGFRCGYRVKTDWSSAAVAVLRTHSDWEVSGSNFGTKTNFKETLLTFILHPGKMQDQRLKLCHNRIFSIYRSQIVHRPKLHGPRFLERIRTTKKYSINLKKRMLRSLKWGHWFRWVISATRMTSGCDRIPTFLHNSHMVYLGIDQVLRREETYH
jgi:hypothetical protein